MSWSNVSRLAAAAMALAALSAMLVPPAPAQAAPPVAGGVAVPAHRLIQSSPAQLERDLDRIAASGATWLRADIVWGDIEYVRGRFDWAAHDRFVDAAHRRGLKVLGIATVLPAWARPAGTSWNHGATTDVQREGFANFAEQAAERYAGRIDTWEIWNEPNLVQFWSPAPDPADYSALLRAAYPAIKRGNPDAMVISGGTGGAGPDGNDISTVTWYQGLYAAGARPFFDAVAVHPYFDAPVVTSGEMKRAVGVREVMDRSGDLTKEIWGTEVGLPTSGLYSVPEADQARYVSQAFRAWSSMHDRGPLFWYTLNDTAGSDREAFFGLVRPDGSLKPSYGELRSYLTETAAESWLDADQELRMVVGDPYTDSTGARWETERGFLGGRVATHDVAIAGTSDDRLYQQERYDLRGYSLPVGRAGRYRVELRLAENHFSSGGRRAFDVRAEGETEDTEVDILTRAGGSHRAYTLAFETEVSDGVLDLTFVDRTNYAKVNAVLVRRL